jgi:hypothetical protein
MPGQLPINHRSTGRHFPYYYLLAPIFVRYPVHPALGPSLGPVHPTALPSSMQSQKLIMCNFRPFRSKSFREGVCIAARAPKVRRIKGPTVRRVRWLREFNWTSLIDSATLRVLARGKGVKL